MHFVAVVHFCSGRDPSKLWLKDQCYKYMYAEQFFCAHNLSEENKVAAMAEVKRNCFEHSTAYPHRMTLKWSAHSFVRVSATKMK